jgi:ABC-2 type transport system permease protein
MIWTVLMVCVRRLVHNRIELLLAFVVPIAFFSIFAMIFGGGVGAGSTPNIKVVAVDTVRNDQSRRAIATLHDTAGLHFVRGERSGETEPDAERDQEELTQRQATAMVRRGNAAMAIVIRKAEKGGIRAELLSDSSDQVAPQVVAALVQRALLSVSLPQPPPVSAVAQTSAVVQADSREPASAAPIASIVPATVDIIDVLGENKSNPVVTMYAAGIAVMFLLFGATGGGGALLEERENQTLDRLLTTGLSMDQLLLGKWLYLTLLGLVQTTLMFVWGQAIFGIDLLGHLDGFLIMTLVTAGAAAAFGLLLATLCKTRGQLNGLSVVVVLTMSALGGSMVPRYVMSQSLRDAGLWTFNAWALDGYDKVFWRDMPVGDLWPQMSVLMVSGAVFLVAARLLAIRWETQ